MFIWPIWPLTLKTNRLHKIYLYPELTPELTPGCKITQISCGNHLEKIRKSRQLLEEITATSWGNHGNFFRKSRQLLEEITWKSSTFLRNFAIRGRLRGHLGVSWGVSYFWRNLLIIRTGVRWLRYSCILFRGVSFSLSLRNNLYGVIICFYSQIGIIVQFYKDFHTKA